MLVVVIVVVAVVGDVLVARYYIAHAPNPCIAKVDAARLIGLPDTAADDVAASMIDA